MVKKYRLFPIVSKFFSIVMLFLFCDVYSQNSKTYNNYENDSLKYRIGLTTGSFIPDKQFTSMLNFNVSSYEIFSNKYFRIIQFYEIPNAEIRKEWEIDGLYLTDYLPSYAYFAIIDKDFNLSKLKNYIRTIIPVENKFKIEEELFFNGISKEKDKIDLVISYYKTLNPTTIISDLEARNIKVIQHQEYSRQMQITIERVIFHEIVSLPYIQFIGLKQDKRILENENLSYRNSSGRSNYLNTGNNGLNFNGTGIVIDIGEEGTLGNIIDFKGRFSELTSGTDSNHKLGCFQNASGAGNLDPTNRCNAWGATLISSDNEDYSYNINSYNARYFNHSYGVGIQGGYDLSARSHDLRIQAFPNHIVSYSSGNVGASSGYSPYDLISGWGNITGKMKQNKNHLVVSNLYPNDEVVEWGCSGPSFDGRIIPQLVIAGPEGTSYASPKAIGIFAILEQAYKAINNNQDSSSTLLKGIILNTADDLGNLGPDFKTGYGKPNVRRAYNVILNSQYFSSTIAHGEIKSHTLSIPVNTKQVRVMLIWADVAASINAYPAIVNNINIIAKDPAMINYYPWILDSNPNSTSLNSLAVRGIDNLNTIEQITVDNPSPGNWNFQIIGANVPFGPQAYYIVYEFLSDEIHVGFPISNEKLKSGDTYYLRWDSYGNPGDFTIDYQINNEDWVNIATSISSNNRSYYWVAPTVVGIKKIKFRLKRGNLIVQSGENYIGSIPENFRISNVCDDVVTLKWSPVDGATSYKIYKLGDKYMEEINSNITFFGNSAVILGQSQSSVEYYSISALTNNNEGMRTNAIEKNIGNFGCGLVKWTGNFSSNWFLASNWDSLSVPQITDDVLILSNAIYQPIINNSGAICNNITIENGAVLSMDDSNAYTLSIAGDWINNGVYNRGIGVVEFIGSNPYQEICGNSITDFHVLKVSKGFQDRILEVNSIITLNSNSNPLILSSGTFKISSSSIISPFTSSVSLNEFSCFWNNGATILAGNYSWTLNGGKLKLTSGKLSIGSSSGYGLTYLNGGSLFVVDGTLEIASRYAPNSLTSSGYFYQSGGEIILNTRGSTSTTRSIFEINSDVSFIVTGGSIIIQKSSSNANDYLNMSDSYYISGGNLIIGNSYTPINQIIKINSKIPIFNLEINSENSPSVKIMNSDLIIKNNILLLGGSLDSNDHNIYIAGNFINNGVFYSNFSKVIFNGNATQRITGSVATSFYDLEIDGVDVRLETSNITASTTINGELLINLDKNFVISDGQSLIIN